MQRNMFRLLLYPTPPTPFTPLNAGTQSQLVCSGCRNLLLYPVGATSVCCAVCNAVTAVPPPGTEMAQLVSWRLPHITDVHSWSNKRAMFLLSHNQFSYGSEMCSVYSCDIGRGFNEHS
ncbi:LSD1 zinc finger domain containing protein, expressed [Datura stramonium]|uniref:LSD1 zinc finger domain containing protein, expressed n=1 Tax=Datura stramonium TaxID=4076 RepID=A0ABS8W2V7_DATST|nr:LSD1 zinc finger domain containing protein, expressed [Datura stramonium]